MISEITLNVTARSDQVQGFRYLWMKRVWDFRPSQCCAQCLTGPYVEGIGPDMGPVELRIPAEEGEVFYLCGVSKPYDYALNLHLALRAKPGASALIDSYRGDRFEVLDAEGVPFDDTAVHRGFPEASIRQAKCRCYQFGAHLQAAL